MAEDEGVHKKQVFQLFQNCKLLHRKAYPNSLLDISKLDLTGQLTHGDRALARGHFSDVFKGKMREGGPVVAIKRLRLPSYSTSNEELFQRIILRFFRELSLWAELGHSNVARLLGFTMKNGDVSLVSHWYENGNLVNYLKVHPAASKRQLMLNVAEGIKYLHSCKPPLVHGDLKAENVLVDEGGVARLADFGISRQMDDINGKTGFTTTSGVRGTTPWMAPELFLGSPSLTIPSDIYSCAGVFLEICCPGKWPYHYYIDHPGKIVKAKSYGQAPHRSHYPEMHSQDALWQLMKKCWQHIPKDRPSIRGVLRTLHKELQPTPKMVLKKLSESETSYSPSLSLSQGPSSSEVHPYDRTISRYRSNPFIPRKPKTRIPGAPTFGIPLPVQMSNFSTEVPPMLEMCCSFVEAYYLSSVGVYWSDCKQSKVTKLIDLLRSEEDPDLLADEWMLNMVVPSLLKYWLMSLPDPLVPSDWFEGFIDPTNIEDDELREEEIYYCMDSFNGPTGHYWVLKYLMKHLAKVQERAATNHMTAAKLAIVFAPIVFGSPKRIMSSIDAAELKKKQCNAIEIFLVHYKEIFARDTEDLSDTEDETGTEIGSETEVET